ncbi:MAG: LCP family protein [Clostridiales bacterium]|jgi:LCP family protein required for cell wall assembly|nr:LCP family protein [Clostridiales bacterium]
MHTQSNQKRKTHRKLWIILSVVLVILAAFSGGAVAYVNSLLSSSQHLSRDAMPILDDSDVSQTGQEPPADSVNGTDLTFAQNLSSDPHVMNIMLYGSDRRPNDGGQYGNADAMVLLSIDTEHRKLKMTSFMRDTWVMVPGKREYRLNTAYLLGGPRLSIDTVERNFGIKVDKYAVVDFDTFPAIIDSLGGITIEITDVEANYLNKIYKTDLFQPGPCAMNGGVALDYARARHLEGDDFGRTQRHRKVLGTVVSQFRHANLGQIAAALETIMPMITTDLTNEERLQMLPNALEYMKYDVVEYRIPEDGTYRQETYYYQDLPMDVMVIEDMDHARETLHRFLYEE